MYDWTGSKRVFGFRNFGVAVVDIDGRGADLILFPAMPDEDSEEDQQDA